MSVAKYILVIVRHILCVYVLPYFVLSLSFACRESYFFNNKNQKDGMKSFSFPFVAIRNVELEQPVFGANYIKGFYFSPGYLFLPCIPGIFPACVEAKYQTNKKSGRPWPT